MTRTVPEWTASHDDQAIPPRVKLRVFDGQTGRRAECARQLVADLVVMGLTVCEDFWAAWRGKP